MRLPLSAPLSLPPPNAPIAEIWFVLRPPLCLLEPIGPAQTTNFVCHHVKHLDSGPSGKLRQKVCPHTALTRLCSYPRGVAAQPVPADTEREAEQPELGKVTHWVPGPAASKLRPLPYRKARSNAPAQPLSPRVGRDREMIRVSLIRCNLVQSFLGRATILANPASTTTTILPTVSFATCHLRTGLRYGPSVQFTHGVFYVSSVQRKFWFFSDYAFLHVNCTLGTVPGKFRVG